jgi:hypothetical protein
MKVAHRHRRRHKPTLHTNKRRLHLLVIRPNLRVPPLATEAARVPFVQELQLGALRLQRRKHVHALVAADLSDRSAVV